MQVDFLPSSSSRSIPDSNVPPFPSLSHLERIKNPGLFSLGLGRGHSPLRQECSACAPEDVVIIETPPSLPPGWMKTPFLSPSVCPSSSSSPPLCWCSLARPKAGTHQFPPLSLPPRRWKKPFPVVRLSCEPRGGTVHSPPPFFFPFPVRKAGNPLPAMYCTPHAMRDACHSFRQFSESRSLLPPPPPPFPLMKILDTDVSFG